MKFLINIKVVRPIIRKLKIGSFEFNLNNEDIKICTPHHLKALKPEVWHHQIWISHFFKHTKYNDFTSNQDQQLKI